MNAGSQLVDAVLGFMVFEWIVLTLYRVRTRRGLPPADLAIMLAAGAGLLLAMRAALTGAAQYWVVICLVAAGVAHLVDLLRRCRGGPESRIP